MLKVILAGVLLLGWVSYNIEKPPLGFPDTQRVSESSIKVVKKMAVFLEKEPSQVMSGSPDSNPASTLKVPSNHGNSGEDLLEIFEKQPEQFVSQVQHNEALFAPNGSGEKHYLMNLTRELGEKIPEDSLERFLLHLADTTRNSLDPGVVDTSRKTYQMYIDLEQNPEIRARKEKEYEALYPKGGR